jgi:hypothetical protein
MREKFHSAGVAIQRGASEEKLLEYAYGQIKYMIVKSTPLKEHQFDTWWHSTTTIGGFGVRPVTSAGIGLKRNNEDEMDYGDSSKAQEFASFKTSVTNKLCEGAGVIGKWVDYEKEHGGAQYLNQAVARLTKKKIVKLHLSPIVKFQVVEYVPMTILKIPKLTEPPVWAWNEVVSMPMIWTGEGTYPQIIEKEDMIRAVVKGDLTMALSLSSDRASNLVNRAWRHWQRRIFLKWIRSGFSLHTVNDPTISNLRMSRVRTMAEAHFTTFLYHQHRLSDQQLLEFCNMIEHQTSELTKRSVNFDVSD